MLSRLIRIAATLLALAGALAAPLAAAADPARKPEAGPALWVVKDQDSTIYLMGTVHILPAGTVWRTPRIEKAVAEADELWLEIADISSFSAQILSAVALVGHGVSFGPPLSKRLTPPQYERLADLAAQSGMSVDTLDHMRPWLAGMMIGNTPSGGRTVPGVDVQLQKRFSARNLPVHGFETIDSQIKVFSTLPEKDELGFLLDALNASDEAGDVPGEDLPSLVRTWLAGDTTKIAATVNRPMLASSPALYDALIAKRNAGFANGIEKLLQGKGVAFIAIGAAHLAGPDSVQAYLATKGIYAHRQ